MAATAQALRDNDSRGNSIDRHDGTDVEMALIVGFTYGFTREHLEPLLDLSPADWRQRHEDVVTALLQDRHLTGRQLPD